MKRREFQELWKQIGPERTGKPPEKKPEKKPPEPIFLREPFLRMDQPGLRPSLGWPQAGGWRPEMIAGSENPEDNQPWKNPNIFEYYEQGRRLFRGLNGKIVQDVVAQFVKPDDSIVEVGAGAGELSRLVPEDVRARMVHTERNPKFARIAKEKLPDSRVVAAAIEHLPFRDSSIDVAAGYSMFDTLPKAKPAVEELHRVLNEGGRFIHFLDLQHNWDVLFRDFGEQGKIVFPDPLPHLIVDEQYDFSTATREDIERVLAEMPPDDPSADLMRDYIADPIHQYQMLQMIDSQVINLVMLEFSKKGVGFFPLSSKRHLQSKMENLFTEAGFQVLKNDFPMKEEVIPRDKRFAAFPLDQNAISNSVGMLRGGHDKALPEGMVKLSSTIHAFVAEKQ